MSTPRERRLLKEFELLTALWSPFSLFQFQCADLSAKEAAEFLRTKISFDVIKKGLPGFLEPKDFKRQHPGVPPEKYLILYTCKGLMQRDDGSIVEAPLHTMEVIFGWDYPGKPPIFVWHTPIWHPNLKPPYICVEGLPFAVGLTLDQIVLEVGRMIQYQNYNVSDPLNEEAADWARKNPHRFPVDDRNLLDRREKVGARRAPSAQDELLVEIVLPNHVEMRQPDQLIELVEMNVGDVDNLKGQTGSG